MSCQGTHGYCVNMAICSPEVDKSADKAGFLSVSHPLSCWAGGASHVIDWTYVLKRDNIIKWNIFHNVKRYYILRTQYTQK